MTKLTKHILSEIFGFLNEINDVKHLRFACKRFYQIGTVFEIRLRIFKCGQMIEDISISINRCARNKKQ